MDDNFGRLGAGTATSILGEHPGAGGYRALGPGPGEPRLLRTDLGGVEPSAALQPLLSFVHLSDLHVTDGQSPARAEFFDRLSDPDSSWLPRLGLVETYRPQESLSCHVVEAMVRAVRGSSGPVSKLGYHFAIATGDATDNAQRNELDNYLALLDGGLVEPDSGDRHTWEGVGGEWGPYDPHYWHPDGAPHGEPPDRPTSQFGFPTVTGLLDACRQPWRSAGLDIPWYAVYGNHDGLLCGTLTPTALLQHLAQGTKKLLGWGVGANLSLLTGHDNRPPELARVLEDGHWAVVTPDPGRRFIDRQEWISAHLESPGAPHGHGLSEQVATRTGIYYGFDADPFRCMVLDTNNPNGGWEGSLDQVQMDWLTDELESAPNAPVLLFSHHPLESLTNNFSLDGAPRTTAENLRRLLGRHPNVVAWFAGHTHCNKIRPISTSHAGTGLWQVTTGSHIDWPQQARAVELILDRAHQQLLIATTPFDHAGLTTPLRDQIADPLGLAAWSRELTFNDYQKRRSPVLLANHGRPEDRCTVLVLPLQNRPWRGATGL